MSEKQKQAARKCAALARLAAPRKKDEGYGAFYFEGRHHPAPRMALRLVGVEVPSGMVVCHRCDNPPCCNPAHLFVGRPQDNDADRVAKKRQAFGARNGNAQLDDMKVWMMRRLRAVGFTYSQVARSFGVTLPVAGDEPDRDEI